MWCIAWKISKITHSLKWLSIKCPYYFVHLLTRCKFPYQRQTVQNLIPKRDERWNKEQTKLYWHNIYSSNIRTLAMQGRATSKLLCKRSHVWRNMFKSKISMPNKQFLSQIIAKRYPEQRNHMTILHYSNLQLSNRKCIFLEYINKILMFCLWFCLSNARKGANERCWSFESYLLLIWPIQHGSECLQLKL